MEEGEISDTDTEEVIISEDGEVDSDFSPESPQGDLVEEEPTNEVAAIPLERLEEEEGGDEGAMSSSDDDEVEILEESKPKQFKKYWEDFEDEVVDSDDKESVGSADEGEVDKTDDEKGEEVLSKETPNANFWKSALVKSKTRSPSPPPAQAHPPPPFLERKSPSPALSVDDELSPFFTRRGQEQSEERNGGDSTPEMDCIPPEIGERRGSQHDDLRQRESPASLLDRHEYIATPMSPSKEELAARRSQSPLRRKDSLQYDYDWNTQKGPKTSPVTIPKAFGILSKALKEIKDQPEAPRRYLDLSSQLDRQLDLPSQPGKQFDLPRQHGRQLDMPSQPDREFDLPRQQGRQVGLPSPPAWQLDLQSQKQVNQNNQMSAISKVRQGSNFLLPPHRNPGSAYIIDYPDSNIQQVSRHMIKSRSYFSLIISKFLIN